MEKMNYMEYRKMMMEPKNKNKYNRVKLEDRTWIGTFRGRVQKIVFDSRTEMNYCVGLMSLQRNGQIKDLSLQESFLLTEKTETERKQVYKADFYYYDCILKRWVAGDVKSEGTRNDQKYVNKRKLFKQKYPNIEFQEVLL